MRNSAAAAAAAKKKKKKTFIGAAGRIRWRAAHYSHHDDLIRNRARAFSFHLLMKLFFRHFSFALKFLFFIFHFIYLFFFFFARVVHPVAAISPFFFERKNARQPNSNLKYKNKGKSKIWRNVNNGRRTGRTPLIPRPTSAKIYRLIHIYCTRRIISSLARKNIRWRKNGERILLSQSIRRRSGNTQPTRVLVFLYSQLFS